MRRFFYFELPILDIYVLPVLILDWFQNRGKKSLFQAAFFLRLCAKANNPASVVTFSLPLSINLLNPWLFFMLANTGSTSQHRCLRFFIPSSLINSWLACCFNSLRRWLISIILSPLLLWQVPFSGQLLQFFAWY